VGIGRSTGSPVTPTSTTRWATALILAAALVTVPGVTPAEAAQQACGTSGKDSICISVPSATLSGNVAVSAQDNTRQDGVIQVTWTPISGNCLPGVSGACVIILQTEASPWAGDYSFVWPTQKYLDGTGTLTARLSGASGGVSLTGLTLSNGNNGHILSANREPADWADFLPGGPSGPPGPAWNGSSDPVVAAVGDGANNEDHGQNVADSVVAADPDLFLYLGDVYEEGTYAEMWNHYGWNPMDGPCPYPLAQCGNSWGKLTSITQPTIGNHEYDASPGDGSPWVDYWHQRPLYTSYVFANTLFFDLNCGPSASGCPVGTNSAQYAYVSNLLSVPHPPCVVAYWHIPTLPRNGTVNPTIGQMWKLLVDGGVSVVLNGHVHGSLQTVPLNDQAQAAAPSEPSTVQLIEGSGGDSGSSSTSDPRFAWHVASGTFGAVYMTLNGAENGGTPTSISWSFEDTDHNVLHSDSVACPGQAAVPSVDGFSPTSGSPGTSVTITGSGFTGASDVTFGGTSAGSGFVVDNDTQITATVPPGATTGQVCVSTPGGTGCSAADFTITPASGPSYVGQIGSVSNTSGTNRTSLSATVGAGGVQAGDTIVLGVAGQASIVVNGASDSAGNTYHVDVTHPYGGTGACTAAIISAPVTNALSPGQTITVTVSSGKAWGFVADEWSGLTGIVDATGQADSNSVKTKTASASTGAATTQANEAVIGSTCVNAQPGITAGASFTLSKDLGLSFGSTTRELGAEYRTVSATGVQTATFTLGRSQNWSAVVATYA
jgi:Calcineurin-like phosphoesterase